MLSLGTAVTALTGLHLDYAVLSKSIVNVVIASRQAVQDTVFVALAGEKDDGHQYLEQAFGRGAIAALVEHDVGSNFSCLDLASLARESSSKFLHFLSSTISFPPATTEFTSDELAPHISCITGAGAIGCQEGPLVSIKTMSARLPVSIDPISSLRPRASAAPIVINSSA